jgi:hypothetical protein
MPRPRLIRIGVQRIEDPHHPRGYRELRSPAEMRKLLNRKIVEQDRKCAICHEEFTDYNDIVPDHRDPKGIGGAWRDDHPDNIRQRTGGAMERKDQPGLATDCRLADCTLWAVIDAPPRLPQCANCVHVFEHEQIAAK